MVTKAATRDSQAPRKTATFLTKSAKTCSRCGAKGHTGNECRRNRGAEFHNCGKKANSRKGESPQQNRTQDRKDQSPLTEMS